MASAPRAATQWWVNGRRGEHIAVADRGFQFGDGLFETLAVRGGRPCHWDRHLARLHRGCERLGLQGVDGERLTREAQDYCAGTEQGVLKVLLSRGVAGRGYALPDPATAITRVFILESAPAGQDSGGVALMFCATPLSRNERLAGIKHLNRLEQVLGRAECRSPFADGIMCDTQGDVIETTCANLFFVTRDVLFTPTLQFCGVEGIMRELVLEWARTQAIEIREQPVSRDQLMAADEIFITNSLIRARPVKRIEDMSFRHGSVTAAAAHVLEALEA